MTPAGTEGREAWPFAEIKGIPRRRSQCWPPGWWLMCVCHQILHDLRLP